MRTSFLYEISSGGGGRNLKWPSCGASYWWMRGNNPGSANSVVEWIIGDNVASQHINTAAACWWPPALNGSHFSLNNRSDNSTWNDQLVSEVSIMVTQQIGRHQLHSKSSYKRKSRGSTNWSSFSIGPSPKPQLTLELVIWWFQLNDQWTANRKITDNFIKLDSSLNQSSEIRDVSQLDRFVTQIPLHFYVLFPALF